MLLDINLTCFTFVVAIVASHGRSLPGTSGIGGLGGMVGLGGPPSFVGYNPATTCKVTDWGEWSTKPNIFECGMVFKTRDVVGIRKNCLVPNLVQMKRECGPPSVSKTTYAVKTYFLGQIGLNAALERGGSGVVPDNQVQGTDLLFLVDSSGSIGRANFRVIKEFMKFLLDNIPSISTTGTRVGAITYSDRAMTTKNFGFSDYSTVASLKSAINDISYQGGIWSQTTSALKLADEMFAKEGRRNARKVLFLLTDGPTNGPHEPSPVRIAMNMKARGAEIFAMGFTPNVNESELSLIASSGNHIFYCATYRCFRAVEYLTTRLV
ncbi:unnamed protein product [Owenia fusiformis]|uniref:Uncharacterized protein n=1 Tax=Owenia fusiformis TaxID=6347 RepID=A0A8J1XSN7_OWEFU|nr:unnamed protein product [Owenia fusiformis]